MLAFILGLLVCQHMSASWSTRLPLEVYELAPLVATTAAQRSNGSGGVGVAIGGRAHELNYLQHKSLEYATVNAKTLAANAADATLTTADPTVIAGSDATTTTTTSTTKTTTIAAASASASSEATTTATKQIETADHRQLANANVNANAQAHSHAQQQQLDRRRSSRQMLHILEQQQQHQQQQHHHTTDGLHLQKLHSTTRQTSPKHNSHSRDVRVLYQVGDSEDDLPICAPNAVCSKIDLYETPWIERQCRCPGANRVPNIIVHHHHQGSTTSSVVTRNELGLEHRVHLADKYRSYLEKEKLLQHQRLLGSSVDYADNKIDHAGIRQLMQKLGAVHEDDLQLYSSDFLSRGADNEAVPTSLEQLDELTDNEFPHTPRRAPYVGATHMRHSGHIHTNGRVREIPHIGGCPSGLGLEDGHTIADKTRHYKLCQPIHKLPICKHFRDYTWTLTTSPHVNVTEQIVHCRCPKNSVTYLTKREPAEESTNGYTYLFACSPITRIRCQRKQPCKLFTVRKRQEFLDEVNINALCQCPKAHHCPSHHTQSGVIPGESFLEDNIQTYSGYCMAND